jgi:hypothetical protein
MSILELRQYTMVPGRRDDFVEIFDREFIEAQEALGIEIVGQFRDLDRPDRYVWIRRFPGMEQREASLQAFYSGPVWERHMDAANATMTEWHDVLLLKPAGEGVDIVVDRAARQPYAADAPQGGSVTVLVWDVPAEGLEAAARAAAQAFDGNRGLLVTDPSPNTYQSLPLRADASVVAAVFDVEPADTSLQGRPPAQALRLAPTVRSLLRGALSRGARLSVRGEAVEQAVASGAFERVLAAAAARGVRGIPRRAGR